MTSAESSKETDSRNGVPPFEESPELKEFLRHWYTDVELTAEEIGWFWDKSDSAVLDMLEKLNIPRRAAAPRKKRVGLPTRRGRQYMGE